MPAMSPFAAHFQEQRERKKNMLMRHIDRISLSNKLVACTIAVLLIGVVFLLHLPRVGEQHAAENRHPVKTIKITGGQQYRSAVKK